MKNTLILDADQMITNYRDCMMDFLSDTQGDISVTHFGDDLVRLGKVLQELNSRVPGIALEAFREEMKAASTMMMLDAKDFDQLEVWSKADEDFRIVLFRADGYPVGIIKKEHINW